MSELILDRRAVLSRILQDRDGALIVTGLGSPVWDLTREASAPSRHRLLQAMLAAGRTEAGAEVP